MSNLQMAAFYSFSHGPGMAACSSNLSGSKRAKHGTVQALNVLGYIPGVSMIVGIARMIFAAIAFKGNPETIGMQCLRGIFEILCLGPLMILSDAITSIWFACNVNVSR